MPAMRSSLQISSAIPTISRSFAQLLMLGEDIAFLGRGEAAWRRQTEPVEIGETRHAVNLSPIRAYRPFPILRPHLRRSTIGNVSGSALSDRSMGTRMVALDVAFDHHERPWDRARKIASHHLRFFFQNPKAILRH
jgi:hypothetical protein